MPINHRNFARVATAITLVIAVGASLWFVSPPPVKALDIIITPPSGGNLGTTQTFTVTINVTDIDVLPVTGIDLEIYNKSDNSKKATLEDLPLEYSTKAAHTIIEGPLSGSVQVAAYAAPDWGYGIAVSFGYGYRDPEGLGWHYFGTRGGYGYNKSPDIGTALITYTFYWTTPSGSDWAGNYEIKAFVHGSATQKFSGTSGTFSLSPVITPPTLPAGGSGGGQAGVTSVLNSVTQAGRFKEDVTCRSDDRKVKLFIPKDTIGKNRVGSLLSSISIKGMEETPSLPTECSAVGPVYRLGPDRATFDPPIELTINYDASRIPEGVAEKRLFVATFDTFDWSTSQWVEMESTVDPEANTITAKIGHFSAVAVLASSRPASFTVTDLAITPPEVVSGESVDVSVIVTNTGDLTGSHEVSLKINDVIVQTEEVTLDGGGSKTISFIVTSDTIGEYNVDISGLPGMFEVKPPKPPAPATFTTSALTISPAEVNVEETVTISTTVTNTGDVTGTYQVTLKIDGVAVQVKQVTLDKGTSLDVIFKTAANIAGTYTVDVDGLRGTFMVREGAPPIPQVPPMPQAPPQVPAPTPEPTPTPVSGWLIGGITAMVIVSGVATWVILVRRRPGWKKHLAEIEKQIDQLFKQ